MSDDDLGPMLKRLRVNAGKGPGEVSGSLKIARETLWKWELPTRHAHSRRPSGPDLLRLLDCIGVPRADQMPVWRLYGSVPADLLDAHGGAAAGAA